MNSFNPTLLYQSSVKQMTASSVKLFDINDGVVTKSIVCCVNVMAQKNILAFGSPPSYVKDAWNLSLKKHGR